MFETADIFEFLESEVKSMFLDELGRPIRDMSEPEPGPSKHRGGFRKGEQPRPDWRETAWHAWDQEYLARQRFLAEIVGLVFRRPASFAERLERFLWLRRLQGLERPGICAQAAPWAVESSTTSVAAPLQPKSGKKTRRRKRTAKRAAK